MDRKEFLGGLTTFVTMSYILFVQPVVLGACGMDQGAVFVATAVASGLATLLMGILARYPIALAPAMGHNFFFTYTVVLGMKVSWETALGAIIISGTLFVLLALFGLLDPIIQAIPQSLKNAIAVGIGLLIAFVGMEWSGLVVAKEGTFIGLGNLSAPPVLLTLLGLLLASLLLVRKVPGAFLIAVLAIGILTALLGYTHWEGFFSLPPSIKPTLGKLKVLSALSLGLVDIIFVFFFLDLFDTLGTLIGLAQKAGFMENNTLPRARQAFLADALGTMIGALLGTSTITSYIESSAGIAEGARTGKANWVTAGCFFLSLFFFPFVAMVGKGMVWEGKTYYPAIAPVLILVGMFMTLLTKEIPWQHLEEAIPAFLAIIVMPLTFSITEGIAFGFISYTLLHLVGGKAKEVHPLFYLFSLLFLIRYLLHPGG